MKGGVLSRNIREITVGSPCDTQRTYWTFKVHVVGCKHNSAVSTDFVCLVDQAKSPHACKCYHGYQMICINGYMAYTDRFLSCSQTADGFISSLACWNPAKITYLRSKQTGWSVCFQTTNESHQSLFCNRTKPVRCERIRSIQLV